MIIHITNSENIGYVIASAKHSAFRLIDLSTFEIFGEIYWSKGAVIYDYGDSGDVLNFIHNPGGIH